MVQMCASDCSNITLLIQWKLGSMPLGSTTVSPLFFRFVVPNLSPVVSKNLFIPILIVSGQGILYHILSNHFPVYSLGCAN